MLNETFDLSYADTLWKAADALRGQLDAAEYKHGIEANLGPAPSDTFLRDAHSDLKANFVLANSPFNVSQWSGQLLRGDRRWTYGDRPIENANYA